eukprot:scaffold14743_cov95-Cylindrotheca_fusiformis.AAC.1
MVLEEYDPELIYVKGENNIVADALSRLDLLDDVETSKDTVPEKPTNVSLQEYLAISQDELPQNVYPLRMSLISTKQAKDVTIQTKLKDTTSGYISKQVRGG